MRRPDLPRRPVAPVTTSLIVTGDELVFMLATSVDAILRNDNPFGGS
jgi:hypothetical protein